MNLADFRREYKAGSLRREDLNPNPIAQFENWFAHAREIKSPGDFFRRLGVAQAHMIENHSCHGSTEYSGATYTSNGGSAHTYRCLVGYNP